MSHKEKLILHVLIGFVGYMVWALMAFFDPTLRHDFLVFNIGMATGTIGLALRDMKAVADAPLPAINKQGGFARPALLAVMTLSALAALSACSLVPQRMSAVQEGVAQTVVQSSERTICRDIPIGTWLRLYGANADRLKGWQALCFNPVTAPLNAETIAAILRVYPGFVATSRAVPPPVTSDSLLGVGGAVQSGSPTPAGAEGAK